MTIPLSEDEARTFDREKRRAYKQTKQETSEDVAEADFGYWPLIIVVAVVAVVIIGSVNLLLSDPSSNWPVPILVGGLLIGFFMLSGRQKSGLLTAILVGGYLGALLMAHLLEWIFIKPVEWLLGSQRPTQRLSRRQPIPSDVKQAVFERDSGRCVHCGAEDELQFDHIIPVAKGGGVSPENIQVLCGPCNRAKGAAIH